MTLKKITICAVFLTLLIGFDSATGLASARVAVLVSFDNSATKQMAQAFQEHLQSHGEDVDIELYQLEKSAKKAKEAAKRIKEKSPDLIFSMGSLATATAGTIQDLPVVASMLFQKEDLEKHQNITGVALEFPIEVQFKWILRFLPEAKNIGVIYNPAENSKKIESAQSIAKKMGLKLVARAVTNPNDLPAALKQLSTSADVLWGLNDKIVLNKKTIKNILLFSFRNRIPFVGLSASWVKAGAFYALDRDYNDIGRQCGEMALKILQGSQVKSIKPAFPRGVTYSLNLKTAERMKVDVAQDLIQGANRQF